MSDTTEKSIVEAALDRIAELEAELARMKEALVEVSRKESARPTGVTADLSRSIAKSCGHQIFAVADGAQKRCTSKFCRHPASYRAVFTYRNGSRSPLARRQKFLCDEHATLFSLKHGVVLPAPHAANAG